MVIRVDKDNYFFDVATMERLEGYDPLNKNLKFHLHQNGYTLIVDRDCIKVSKLGICFQFRDTKYIIDDNRQYVLQYAAYIINDSFRYQMETNFERGLKTRESISDIINDSIRDHFSLSNITLSNINRNALNFCCDFEDDVNKGKIVIQTISNLVNVNKTRRKFDLPYYPYIRGIDRYNSYYMSIWCDSSGSSLFDVFLGELVEKMNEKDEKFSFEARTVKIHNRLFRVRDELITI